MTNHKSIANTLLPREMDLVHAVRRYLHAIPYSSTADDPFVVQVDIPLTAFLDTMWSIDPYSVDLNHPADPDISVFEIQFVYAISEQRAGRSETVEELLRWWFPENQIRDAAHKLKVIADICDATGMPSQSSDRLRAHLLAVSAARVKEPVLNTRKTDVAEPGSRLQFSRPLH